MSVGGSSPLGTLLVQRLDAVLGTTLSQQANLVTGARPDAVAQAASPERAEGARNETLRHPRDVVDRAAAQTEQNSRNTVDKARQEARSGALLLARDLPNTASTPSAPTTLGHAAKTILALLAGYPELPAPARGRQPLLQSNAQAGAGGQAGASGGSATTARVAAGTAHVAASSTAPQAGSPVVTQLAAALSQAVQGSGLFYEAHLAGLAFGKFSPAQLMQEPQAQIGRSAKHAVQNPGAAATSSSAQAAAASSGSAPSAAAPNPSLPPSAVQDAAITAISTPRGESSLMPLPAGTLASTQGTQAVHIPGLDPQAHTLVRQQLEVLANQSFAWQGEAWPGAGMDWEITRREAQDHEATEAASHWATRLTLSLPGLGEVQARLNLAGKQLVMHLVSPQSAELLDTHAEALRNRYAAQGLQLSQLSILSTEAQQQDAPPLSEDSEDGTS